MFAVWKECYDELTGYSYYWNVKTDEVTWERPAKFVPQKKSDSSEKPDKKPVRRQISHPPILPVKTKVPENSVKIYSIGNTNRIDASAQNFKRNSKKSYRRESDSEDE